MSKKVSVFSKDLVRTGNCNRTRQFVVLTVTFSATCSFLLKCLLFLRMSGPVISDVSFVDGVWKVQWYTKLKSSYKIRHKQVHTSTQCYFFLTSLPKYRYGRALSSSSVKNNISCISFRHRNLNKYKYNGCCYVTHAMYYSWVQNIFFNNLQ